MRFHHVYLLAQRCSVTAGERKSSLLSRAVAPDILRVFHPQPPSAGWKSVRKPTVEEMAGTGANSVPLSHLHPILAAKLATGGGAQGGSSGAIPLPGGAASSTDKLEKAKRAASALFPG